MAQISSPCQVTEGQTFGCICWGPFSLVTFCGRDVRNIDDELCGIDSILPLYIHAPKHASVHEIIRLMKVVPISFTGILTGAALFGVPSSVEPKSRHFKDYRGSQYSLAHRCESTPHSRAGLCSKSRNLICVTSFPPPLTVCVTFLPVVQGS